MKMKDQLITFPQSLEEWNFEIIETLVNNKYSETELFDFKGDLPDNEIMEKIVCSFANTVGGFIIFGIRDIQKTERIVGIKKNRDFIKQFNDKVKKIIPSIYYEFKQPPISIPKKDTVIQICYIPSSSEKPHMTSNKKFYIRSLGGSCEEMDYIQLRKSFYGYEQRRIKLEMFGMELIYMRDILKNLIIPAAEIETKYVPHGPDGRLLIELVGQIYPVVKEVPIFFNYYLTLRNNIDSIQQKVAQFTIEASLPLSNIKVRSKTHNEYIHKHISQGLMMIDNLLIILRTHFNFVEPYLKGKSNT